MNLAHTFVQNSKYCRTTKQNRTEEELNLSCPLLLFVCSDSQKLYMLWFLSPFISPFGLPSILLSYSPSLYTPLFVLSNLHLPRSPFITSDQRRGNFDAWASSQTQKGIFSPDHSEADASSWCEVCNFLPRSFFLCGLQPPSPPDSRLRQWIMMSGRSWVNLWRSHRRIINTTADNNKNTTVRILKEFPAQLPVPADLASPPTISCKWIRFFAFSMHILA